MKADRAKKNWAVSMTRVREAVRRIKSGGKFGTRRRVAGTAKINRAVDINKNENKIPVMAVEATCQASF